MEVTSQPQAIAQHAGQDALRKVIAEDFERIRAKNPAFSLRALARKLDLSPSAVSEILNNKRRVSRKLAERLIHTLALGPQESQAVLDLFPQKNIVDTSELEAASVELTAEQFRFVSEWIHPAILLLSETVDFKSDVTWIARRLQVESAQVEDAIARLIQLELLTRSAEGTFKSTGKHFRTSDQVIDTGVRKFNQRALEMAQDALNFVPITHRDSSTMTMAIDPDRWAEAQRMIREFRRSLCAYLEGGTKKEVYQLNINLFPISATSHEGIQNEKNQ